LENDADSGEDKIAKKARLEQLEPMEIVQYYTYRYHDNISKLNCRPPSIEPRASGHIIEQIEMVKQILNNGFAYEVNGSVYFDVIKYSQNNNYGKLSGRVLDELLSNTRDLDGQDEKKNSVDFALWKKASPEHIMRWPSPWGEGFPGWHLECSVMSTKYLGETFDIHGGGMDLLFPHHECEIAQSKGAVNKEPAKYWLHCNMITIGGQKMGKSLGNFITLDEFFTGNNKMLWQAYSPMTIRFFMLQAHYRGTLDFSNEALQAAEKGLHRLMEGVKTAKKISSAESSTVNIASLSEKLYAAMNEDFNTPVVLAGLFEAVKTINQINEGTETISVFDLEKLNNLLHVFVFEILGLSNDKAEGNNDLLNKLMNLVLDIRQDAKIKKDYSTSDKIRDSLSSIGVSLKDGKEGTTWTSAS
jgi:cysteinyl-tRNA synthetase